jgi:hypothetical protein
MDPSGQYSLVPGYDKEDKDQHARQKLLRSIGRRVRSMSSIPTCGRHGTIWWIICSSWKVVFLYSIYGGLCIAFWYKTGVTLHEALGFPTRPSSISAVIQFLAAFLTGLTMTEAAGRYKAAMASLLEFRDATEALRVSLCSSTGDAKLRVSVNIFISWMMCLFQKSIVFYTEDFSEPLRTFIPIEVGACVLYRPEVLWSFDLVQFQYVFSNFMLQSQLWDRKEKMIEKLWQRMLSAFKVLHELLQVRSPTTKFTVGKIAVNMFLVSIPLVNGDFTSPLILPIVAGMFYCVLTLAKELADPWGDGDDGLHVLPLNEVMKFLSSPMFAETDMDEINSSVEWLSSGLQNGIWTYSKGKDTIPRHKAADPNKGEIIDFAAMRTLAEVAGFRSWESFLLHQVQDMGTAERNGRRMPVYLRWTSDGVLANEFV